MLSKTLSLLFVTMLVGCGTLEFSYEPGPSPGQTESDAREPVVIEPTASEDESMPDSREPVGSDSADSRSGDPAEPRSSDPEVIEVDPPAVSEDRAFAMFTVAGGLDQPDMLHYTRMVWEQGWDAYIKRHVEPEIKRGFRRLIILKACGMQPVPNGQEEQWNVVGTRTKTQQPVRSRALTLSQLAEHRPDLASTFVPAWSRVGEQVDELMLYIGLPPADATQEEIEAWVEPFMDIPNVSFGLDSLGAISSDAAGARLMGYLINQGKRVYIEPVMPKDEWGHWPTDHQHFAATVLDRRFDIMLTQDRWHRAEEVADELVVLVQGRSGEDINGRFRRIASYLRGAPPDRASVAFGTRGMTELQIKSLIDLGKR